MVERKILVVVASFIVIVVTVSFYFSTSFTETQNASIQVISRNVTLCGGVPDMPRYLFSGIDIRRISIPASTECFPRLNVDLISYQGNYYYYSSNYTYTKNQEQITRTIWLTNSTIHCISPKFEEYNTCPT